MDGSRTLEGYNSTNPNIRAIASRLETFTLNDADSLPRHVLLLINIASFAKGLKEQGLQREAIVEGAVTEGKRVAFEDQEARFSNIKQKLSDAADLFLNDSELAIASCKAFIDFRAGMAKSDEQKKETRDQYGEALQRILSGVGTSETTVAPRKLDPVAEMLIESTKDNRVLLARVTELVGILNYYHVRGEAMIRSNPNYPPFAVEWRVVHEFAEGNGYAYARLEPATIEQARKLMREKPDTVNVLFNNLDKDAYKEARELLEKALGIEKMPA